MWLSCSLLPPFQVGAFSVLPSLSSTVQLRSFSALICIHLSVEICVFCWSLHPQRRSQCNLPVGVFVISSCKMTSHSHVSQWDKDHLSHPWGLLTFSIELRVGGNFNWTCSEKGVGTNAFCLWSFRTIWNTHEIRFLPLSLQSIRLLFQVYEVPVWLRFIFDFHYAQQLGPLFSEGCVFNTTGDFFMPNQMNLYKQLNWCKASGGLKGPTRTRFMYRHRGYSSVALY